MEFAVKISIRRILARIGPLASQDPAAPFSVEPFAEAVLVPALQRPASLFTLALQQAGAEPEESWCIGEEGEFPNLVLEIALTSGGMDKLEIYRRFRVSEVWFWRWTKLEFYALQDSERYELSPRSRLLPGLDISSLEGCVAIRSWQQARQTFRAGLAKA